MKNIKFNNVYIDNYFTLLTSIEKNPVIKSEVDLLLKNDYFVNKKTTEEGECEYQRIALNGLIEKSKIKEENIDALIGGDLQNQIFASDYNASNYNIPFLGVYSACASFIEGLIIASSLVGRNKFKNVAVVSSSNNLVSEKQFRFPVEYGAVRKNVNTCTVSGSVSAVISNNKSNIRIESGTIGFITRTNHKDTNDMGSAMAPSCAEVLIKHLKETKRDSNYYDLILTGDLGIFGHKIVKEYYKTVTKKKLDNMIDAGSIFYSEKNIYAGSSGPVCLPLVLFDYIIPLKKYKKILIIGTGSLHSVTSSNLKLTIPSISHAVSLEVTY